METGQPGTILIEKIKAKEQLSTPWNVIVHNDPINLMSYVAMVFMRVFGYSRAKAETLMLEVHNHGRSLVWSGGHEQAETQWQHARRQHEPDRRHALYA